MNTIAARLVADLRNTAQAFAAGDQVAPVVVLWPDPDCQWQSIIPELSVMLPELFQYGPYSPEKEQDPRCG